MIVRERNWSQSLGSVCGCYVIYGLRWRLNDLSGQSIDCAFSASHNKQTLGGAGEVTREVGRQI